MVDHSEGLQYGIGDGVTALDFAARRDRLDGYAVISGGAVSPGGSLSVDVAALEATVGTDASGNRVTVSTGAVVTKSLNSADSTYPRKDVVWVDATGTVQVATGTAEAAKPDGETRFSTWQPEPEIPQGGTVLAEVWVGAGASSLTSADVRDRRVPARIDAEEVRAGSVNTGEINNDGSAITLGDTLAPDGDFRPLVRKADVFIDVATAHTLADTTREPVADQITQPSGLLIIGDETNNASGVFRLVATGPVSAIDATGFSTTKANQGTVNVYFDSGEHYVENETGADADLSWWVIGAGK